MISNDSMRTGLVVLPQKLESWPVTCDNREHACLSLAKQAMADMVAPPANEVGKILKAIAVLAKSILPKNVTEIEGYKRYEGYEDKDTLAPTPLPSCCS